MRQPRTPRGSRCTTSADEVSGITGLVLAGGQGRRLGGADKGLALWHGEPLVQHALRRLRPQVQRLAVSANRHLPQYRALGVPVWPDDRPGFDGPLAGWAAGLARCETPWLLSVPCDTPLFPLDIAARLAAAAARSGAPLAIARTPGRLQPVFCLLSRTLSAVLAQSLAAGERRVQHWAVQQGAVEVRFEDETAFRNLNTPADWAGRFTSR